MSLVGYTNSGKSTLLNALTDSDTLVQNRLFATLDPRTRRLELPGGEAVLCSDTVGFVRKLPHQLVEAFASTLEIVADADLLVHVVDASATDPEGQMEAVHEVLREIEADKVPELIVFNKLDKAASAAAELCLGATRGRSPVRRSTGAGLDGFLARLSEVLRAADRTLDLEIPYDRGDVVAALHRSGEVLEQSDNGGRLALRVRLDDSTHRRFAEFVVRNDHVGGEALPVDEEI